MGARVWAQQMLSRLLRPILSALELLVVAIGSALVIVSFGQVVLRYVFNTGFFGSEELARYLLTWLVFMSATLGLDRGMHFTVDVAIARLPDAVRFWTWILVQLGCLVILAILVWQGIYLTIATWTQVSSALRIPMSIPYAAIPISCAIMFLIALKQLLSGQRQHTVREDD